MNKKGITLLLIPIIIITGLIILFLPFPRYNNPQIREVCNFVPRDECPKYGLYLGPSIALSFYTKYLKSQQETPSTPTPIADRSHDEVLLDWKTYRNEEYGFEFKYPTDLTVYECNDLSFVAFHQSGSMPPCEYVEFPLPIVVSVVKGNQVENAHYSYSSEENEFQEVSIEPVEIAGINGTSYIIEYVNTLLGSYTLKEARIEKQGKTYIIAAISPTYDTAFNQILSTFRFLESPE